MAGTCLSVSAVPYVILSLKSLLILICMWAETASELVSVNCYYELTSPECLSSCKIIQIQLWNRALKSGFLPVQGGGGREKKSL